MPLALGMNSGSSFDGIDAVLVEIALGSDGQPTPPLFIASLSYDWPPPVRELVLLAFANQATIFDLARLHYVAGAVYAEAALALLAQQGVQAEDVDVIGVDGQTIYQEPPDFSRFAYVPDGEWVARWFDGPYAFGLQIGEPAVIAAACQTPVVWNFRPSDHVLGGTGAPLMQYLDFVAFRDISPVLTLNIGGIANCQSVDSDRSRMMAFDTGPGNVMIDHAMQALFGRPYDAGGQVGASGLVNGKLLMELQTHPFFGRTPPRSAWRLDFGGGYADDVLARHADLAPADIIATFTEFTAWAIVTSLEQYVPEVERIPVLIASGGGVRNAALMHALERRLPARLRLTTSDEYGIPAQYKEAVKFATLAFAARRGLANNIPAASGATSFAILGKLVMPPRAAMEAILPIGLDPNGA